MGRSEVILSVVTRLFFMFYFCYRTIKKLNLYLLQRNSQVNYNSKVHDVNYNVLFTFVYLIIIVYDNKVR